MLSNSVCNHTRNLQIGLPFRGCPILLITHNFMITDRTGLYSVLLPLLTAKVFEKTVCDQLYKYISDNNMLSNCQSVFRTLQITIAILLKSTDEWCLNIDKAK